MTGDVKIELTITAEAVEKIFSLFGLLKESREETREESSPIPLKEENKGEKKESNISSCSYVDDDVVAIKPAIKHVVNNSSNNIASNIANNNDDVVYPPTKEEINEYAESKGYKLDVNRFYLYYSRLGWCNKGGTSIIRTWRDTLDYWMTNGLSTSSAMQPVDKNNREALKATHPFVPTEF